jgi:hypothetical protein
VIELTHSNNQYILHYSNEFVSAFCLMFGSRLVISSAKSKTQAAEKSSAQIAINITFDRSKLINGAITISAAAKVDSNRTCEFRNHLVYSLAHLLKSPRPNRLSSPYSYGDWVEAPFGKRKFSPDNLDMGPRLKRTPIINLATINEYPDARAASPRSLRLPFIPVLPPRFLTRQIKAALLLSKDRSGF